MYACIYVYIYIYTNVCICISLSLYIYIYIYIISICNVFTYIYLSLSLALSLSLSFSLSIKRFNRFTYLWSQGRSTLKVYGCHERLYKCSTVCFFFNLWKGVSFCPLFIALFYLSCTNNITSINLFFFWFFIGFLFFIFYFFFLDNRMFYNRLYLIHHSSYVASGKCSSGKCCTESIKCLFPSSASESSSSAS